MTTAKIAFVAAVAAVFSFALGIYFHSSLPEVGREIASLPSAGRSAASAKADPRVSQALKDCLGEKVEAGKVALSKVIVDGRSWAIVSMDCVGENAKQLYEAVGPYSSEQYVSYSDRRKGVARFFGRLYPPSQCVRVIRTSRGSELNLYSCSVRIDLDHELVEGLKL